MLATILRGCTAGESGLVATALLHLGLVLSYDYCDIVYSYLVALGSAAVDVLQPWRMPGLASRLIQLVATVLTKAATPAARSGRAAAAFFFAGLQQRHVLLLSHLSTVTLIFIDRPDLFSARELFMFLFLYYYASKVLLASSLVTMFLIKVRQSKPE
jgi:hypothetical protein